MAIQTEMIPMPLEAGAEMAALARFHRDVTWTGTIEPNAFGPGSPPMTAVGEGVHRFIQDGLWIVGDHRQDQFLADGTFVARWQLHWVAGWDPQAKEYRATVADNYGHADVLRGRIDGDLLTFTPRRLSTSARGAEAIMTTDVSHRVEKLPAASNLGDDDEARQEWLVAPAIHDAAVLPVHDMMARLRDLGEQGVESVHGVIYPPQVALVGAGRIVQRPLGGRRPAGRKTVRDAHSRRGSPGDRQLHRRPLPGHHRPPATDTGGAMTLTMQDARELVGNSLLRIVPDADLATLPDDAPFREELELDSLDFLSFVELLSTGSGRRIDEDGYPRLRTTADCVTFHSG